jgi:hypothetical protein
VHRNQGNTNWLAKALTYLAATTVAGTVSGALLGAAGGAAPVDVRTVLASVSALAGVTIGIVELSGRRIRLPQWDRETPQSWVHAGGLRWAILNGAALGFGATTRVGFWLWYAIPIGSFASGHPAIGAAAYGAYGLVRGAGATAMIYVGRGRTLDELALALLGRAAAVRRLAAAQLAAFGLVVATAVGVYGL